MLQSVALIAGLMFVLWIGGYVAYLVSSRGQRNIENEIAELKSMLGDDKQE